MKNYLLVFTLVFSGFVWAEVGDQIRYLPVQDSGRIKPFDTFAAETLELVYGKKKYTPKGSREAVSAHWIVLTWMLSPASWSDQELFEIKHLEVKEKLQLSKEQTHFAGNRIFDSDKFASLMQELQNKRESKEKLTPYFQAIQRLENQFFVFQEMAAGNLLRIYPLNEESTWLSVSELPEEAQLIFLDIAKKIAAYLGLKAELNVNSTQIESLAKDLDETVLQFEALASKSAPTKYDLQSKIKTEVLYNDVHPFRWAYISYLIAALCLIFSWIRNQKSGLTAAWVFVGLGFLIHTMGFAFRVYLAGRPPVSNMYETVVWTSWGVVLFAVILEAIYKYRYMLFAGAMMGLFALVVADSAPAVLDPSLQPLEAVLRSNYWLIVHVMTITISYAAFLLAFGLGDLGLVYYIINEEKYREQIQQITTGVYRSMQIGVAFLAPGIILGGIWADYSWGRFWGWDPKETWALIVLLGYIVILHARLTGWLKNFGTLAAGVITFSLVIMAWYGVNFVLGAGLHSYGFGAGGVEYVTLFVGLHFLFVAYSYIIHRNRKSNDKKPA